MEISMNTRSLEGRPLRPSEYAQPFCTAISLLEIEEDEPQEQVTQAPPYTPTPPRHDDDEIPF